MFRMSHMDKNAGMLLMLLVLMPLQLQLQLGIVEARCNRPDDLANGSIMQRRRFLRFRCFNNYILLGRATLTCGLDGRLSGERPFCARPGCTTPADPENGEIELQRGLTAVVVCKENFVVMGNALAYCNGNAWDRQLGGCRHRNHSLSHACDFESEDLCGWTTQFGLLQPWRRVSTAGDFQSYRTGPRHDHTVQNAYGGHYMLMERHSYSSGVYHFASPIYPRELSLKTACCFHFHYYMYGSGVGTLVVSVKPHQMRLDEMWDYRALYQKFNISGNQGNKWLEHTITIDEMSQDFQIVFSATDAKGHFSDIAIDDVRLMTGRECGGGGITTTTEEPAKETMEPAAFDMMSCENRCNMSEPAHATMLHLLWIMACGCNEQCVDDENCCPDYLNACLLREEETTTYPIMLPNTATTTTTTIAPATTSTKVVPTTTTRKTTRPTTTTTTTTTTTSTTSTTTTTTTTRRPTTKRTTPTTTTTTTTTTRRMPIRTTAIATTKATTPRSTTTTRRSLINVTTPTTPKTSVMPNTTTTTTKAIKTTSSSTPLPHDTAARTTPHHRNHFTFAVHSDDLEGDFGKENASNPARFMLYFMLIIMLIIALASVIYRWRRPSGGNTEKAVSFQKTLAKLKNVRLPRGNRIGRSEASAPLCDNATDNDEVDDDVQFEEMGVDIRNVTVL